MKLRCPIKKVGASTVLLDLPTTRLAEVVTPERYGAKADGVTDSTSAFIAAFASNPGCVVGEKGTYKLTDTITMTAPFRGQGLRNGTYLEFDMTGTEAIITDCQGGYFKNFRVTEASGSSIDTGIKNIKQRVDFESVRVEIEANNEQILNQSFIVTFFNCQTANAGAGDITGLRLNTASNAIKIIGGEYANSGDCIVIEAGSSAVYLNTTIEGIANADLFKGLKISGGKNIVIDNSYFELKGVDISGGTHIRFINTSLPYYGFAISGGEVSIENSHVPTFTVPAWKPRISGGSVSFKNVDYSEGTDRTFAATLTPVQGPNIGKNLLPDGNFDLWSGNTPAMPLVTVQTDGAITKSTTALHGNYSLKWTNDADGTDPQGIVIELDHYCSQLEDKPVTVGAWIYIDDTTNCEAATYLIANGVQLGSSGTYKIRGTTTTDPDAWVFVGLSEVIPDGTTTLDLVIGFSFNTISTVIGDDFLIDSVYLVEGHSNYPKSPFTVTPRNELRVSTTWDPGNLVDGAGETHSLTVVGAELGDFVSVAAPYDLQDITCAGYVQAANTVEIRLQNESGNARDLASGTWTVMVTKGW